MKKAILFGSNGYLGRHLACFLTQNNIDFIPVDIADTSIDHYENYRCIDITNNDQLKQLDFHVDYVFAFAGLTGTGISPEMEVKFNMVNELGLANVLGHCKTINKLRVIFPSTRLVYKGIKNMPLSEESEKEKLTVYAKNKLFCEELLKKSGINHTVFRICVPYGNLFDEQYSYGTIGFFLNKAKSKENISIYGDGSLRRTFTHVADICSVILQAIQMEETNNNVYNIGGNDVLSLLEVANLVALKYNVAVEHVDWPEEAFKIESGDTIFDDTRLQHIINYTYKNRLKDWINTL